MTSINVKLFGSRSILNNGHDVVFPYKKAEALFYYLVVNNSASRDELVNMLWGEIDEDTAKKNLRNAVYIIKKLFDQEVIISPQRSVVMLNPYIQLKTDLQDFSSDDENLLVDLYSGDFLEGFVVKDAEVFDGWILSKRAYYRNIIIKRIYDLMHKCIKENNIDKSIEYGELIVTIDKLEEKAYRALMKLYYSQKSSHKSIELYNSLKQVLKTELGVAPDLKTTYLFNKIMDKRTISVFKASKECAEFFYGRNEELETLKRNYKNFIEDSSSRSYIILGEAGIGKTGLKDRFLSGVNSDETFLVETSCYQAEQSYILKPWNTVFSKLSSIIENERIHVPLQWSNIISLLFPTFIDASQHVNIPVVQNVDNMNFQAAEESIIGLLSKVCQHKKMILVFEDIHWIDSRSLSLLKSIVLSRNKNLMIIATCRNEFTSHLEDFICSLVKYDLLRKVILNRFSKAQVAELLSSALPDFKFTSDLQSRIFKETEGNTFFIVELINNIIEKKEMVLLSPKAQDILKTRFLNLSNECKNVLDTLSVFIEKGNFNTLKNICEIDEFQLMDILDGLKDRYLIKDAEDEKDIVFEFTHQKLKEFVYSELSPSRKKLLHYRIAQFLESQLKHNYSDTMLYSQLIYHFTNAGKSVEALKYSIINADNYLQSAQELFPILVDTTEEKSKYSFVSLEETDKFLSEIESLLNHVKRETGTNLEVAKLEISYLLMKGRFYIKYGEYDKGLDIIKKMIKYALFYNDCKNALKGYKLMIYYCIQTFTNEEMEEYIEKSLVIAGEHSLHEEEGTLLRFKGLLNIFKGQYSEAEYFLKQSIQIFEMLNMSGGKYILSIAAAYNYIGETRRHNKSFSEAIEYYCKAIDMCANNNILRGLSTFYKNAGQCTYHIGDYSGALSYFDKASRISEELDSIWGRSTINAYLSLILIKLGNYSESLRKFLLAEQDSKVLKIPYELGILYWVKAEIKKELEDNSKLKQLFSMYLDKELKYYCREGMNLLSSLKGSYEIEFLKSMFNCM